LLLVASVPDDTPTLAYTAKYGVNSFVVKSSNFARKYYPAFVNNVTVYGRLAGKHTIVNVDFELFFNPEVLCV
jgi:hypothetical protein